MVTISQEDLQTVISIWKWGQLAFNFVFAIAWSADGFLSFLIKIFICFLLVGNLMFVFLK